MSWQPPKSFNDFPQQESPPNYMQIDEDIEWLMQPLIYDNPEKETWELVDLMNGIMSTLSDVDQEMLYLVYTERKTFQEAAQIVGIKAKSHAWRKTKIALDNFAEQLKANQQAMKLINHKYNMEEEDETQL